MAILRAVSGKVRYASPRAQEGISLFVPCTEGAAWVFGEPPWTSRKKGKLLRGSLIRSIVLWLLAVSLRVKHTLSGR